MRSSSPRKKEEKERIRQNLLRAALRLASRHGFSSLGLREVSREGGIAPTSFYRHFADMQELGLALIAELVGPLVDRVTRAAREAGDRGQDRAAALLDGLLAETEREPDVLRFVLAERYGAARSFRAPLRRCLDALGSVLNPEEDTRAGVDTAAIAVVLDACDAHLDTETRDRQTTRSAALDVLRWLTRPRSTEGAEA